MGHEAKWEYFRVMYERYSKAKGTERSRLLDEFCGTAGYNRKYTIRLLNGVAPDEQRVKRPRGRKPHYSKQVISILMTVWEAAGYPWSVERNTTARIVASRVPNTACKTTDPPFSY